MLRTLLPSLYQDKDEPFALSAIGATVYANSTRSCSFKRDIVVPQGGMVIEYQLFWLYDIQHLYDLEHIWVTIEQGVMNNLEASFHGRFLNVGRLAAYDESQKPILYCQPGKHAFLPDGKLFQLLPDYPLCCTTQAGNGGFLVMDLFADRLWTNPRRNELVSSYIKQHYAFQPAGEWMKMDTEKIKLLSWEELKEHIVLSIGKELLRIGV